jgi:PilZ domain
MAKFLTQREKRKRKRQPYGQGARIFIDEKTPQIPCVIHDISEGGARLVLKAEHEMPILFSLLLGPKGPRRECRVVRQDGLMLSVAFLLKLN